jgi:hypothetical protein
MKDIRGIAIWFFVWLVALVFFALVLLLAWGECYHVH